MEGVRWVNPGCCEERKARRGGRDGAVRRRLLLLALGWEIPARGWPQVGTVVGVGPRSLEGLCSQTPMKLSPNVRLPQSLSPAGGHARSSIAVQLQEAPRHERGGMIQGCLLEMCSKGCHRFSGLGFPACTSFTVGVAEVRGSRGELRDGATEFGTVAMHWSLHHRRALHLMGEAWGAWACPSFGFCCGRGSGGSRGSGTGASVPLWAWGASLADGGAVFLPAGRHPCDGTPAPRSGC